MYGSEGLQRKILDAPRDDAGTIRERQPTIRMRRGANGVNRKSCLLRLAATVVACGIAAPACVTEIEGQKAVTLPKEAFRYERFIEAAGYLDADSVTIQLLTAYRKDCGIATTASNHLRRETTDRIEL